jgi:hypothetical protein
MTLTRRIVLSVLWTIVMAGAGLAGGWYLVKHPIAGMSVESSGERFGQAVGLAIAVGYGLLWIPWAYRVGRERRRERAREERNARQARKPRKPKRRKGR